MKGHDADILVVAFYLPPHARTGFSKACPRKVLSWFWDLVQRMPNRCSVVWMEDLNARMRDGMHGVIGYPHVGRAEAAAENNNGTLPR